MSDEREIVMQAVGEASMCWEHVERAGVFDSVRAADVGERLLAALHERDEPMLGLATTEQLLVELQARGETTRYGDESLEADGEALARAAAMLLATLPPKMLAYRTWGEHR